MNKLSKMMDETFNEIAEFGHGIFVAMLAMFGYSVVLACLDLVASFIFGLEPLTYQKCLDIAMVYVVCKSIYNMKIIVNHKGDD